MSTLFYIESIGLGPLSPHDRTTGLLNLGASSRTSVASDLAESWHGVSSDLSRLGLGSLSLLVNLFGLLGVVSYD